MDYVARAKALLIGKARTGALLVLPLAAAVQHAQAQFDALPTGSFSCSSSIGNCTSGGGDRQLSATNGIEGVAYFLNSTDFFSGSSSFVDFQSSGTLLQGASGGLTLPAGTLLTQEYDFTINNVSGGSFSGWSLDYELRDLTTSEILFNDTSKSGGSTGASSGTFTDAIAFALTPGDQYQLNASIDITQSSGGFVSLQIPGGGTLDIGTNEQAPSTPEPSTLSFGALALGIAGIWYRLRRKRTTDAA